MHYTLVMINLFLAIFIAIGYAVLVLIKPEVKERTDKKLPLYICNTISILGLVFGIFGLISLIICESTDEGQTENSTYTEYPVQKLTTDRVYFDDKSYSFKEPYVIIEKPDDEYENVVIAEDKEYSFQWLCRVYASKTIYHVYLSEDNYNKLQLINESILYEQ